MNTLEPLADWLLTFVLLGGFGLVLGFGVKAVSRAKAPRWRVAWIGIGVLLAYHVVLIVWSLVGSCGEGCIIDPSPIFAYLPLQVAGWAVGVWTAGLLHYRLTSI